MNEFENIGQCEHLCIEGQKQENRYKNRYMNIIPFDDTIVKLSSDSYINANYIPSLDLSNDKRYICTQGPMSHTVQDFWQMVVDNNVETIVMLTSIIENGREKCHKYWPTDTFEFDNFNVEFIEEEKGTITRRKFKVNERYVEHLHYTEWPDHGVPSNTKDFIRLVKMVKSTKPIVIHCSAGVGRTGVFGVVHAMTENKKVSLKNAISHFRCRREGCVQTPEQYLFCKKIVDDNSNAYSK